MTDLCWSDKFVLKWRAEVMDLCGSDMLKWRMCGIEVYSPRRFILVRIKKIYIEFYIIPNKPNVGPFQYPRKIQLPASLVPMETPPQPKRKLQKLKTIDRKSSSLFFSKNLWITIQALKSVLKFWGFLKFSLHIWWMAKNWIFFIISKNVQNWTK